MKKFWLVLLSLGLVMAFSASAFAVDVKFSGEYYVAGMYLDRTSFKKDTATDGPSTAFYFQRLRLKTEFVVAPGLSLVTRADIMERAWGAARTSPSTTLDSNSMGTTAENENIAFDYAYVQYASPIGVFAAGYMTNGAWATVFGNSEAGFPKISYMLPIGAYTLIAQYGKSVESSVTAKNPLGIAAGDVDIYYLMQIYAFRVGQVGLGLFYVNNDATKQLGYRAQYLMVEPYAILQLGPVKITTELDYVFGKTRKYDTGFGDIDQSSWNGWIDVVATFGPVYFGGTFAYLAGDDPGTTDKNEGGFTGGTDWNPCLIMFNYDRNYWAGSLVGQSTTAINGAPMTNAFFYQGKVGVKPIEKLDIMASVAYANADKKPLGYGSDAYGWEVDVTGTYKITNNLSYMLGVGYFKTGDYYKGTTNADVNNNYIVINKLTLTF